MPDYYEGHKVNQNDGMDIEEDKQPDPNRFGETPGEPVGDIEYDKGQVGREKIEGVDQQGTQQQVDAHQQPPDLEEGGFDEQLDQPGDGKQKWNSQEGYAPTESKPSS
ncbi:hypothetical protein J4E90_007214 [Alternaria incomplexa]|uniref:uncharacterized protein n=1 Tax=Alternaria incomplexa TaxID=1187928 RepID=UPI0022203853|nr:uncharacterized protein J4E90_007214 [Alternaria incomplexa]KAI4910957.1 hypothetical protein J4E90_007214 [Alternaria incomplexa]